MTGANKAAVEYAIAAFQKGEYVLVGKKNHGAPACGVLACPAEFASDAVVNYMATHARGLVCVALVREQCRRLGLTLQSVYRGAPAFTVSIEAAEGVTTGISAADRARTIEVASNPESTNTDVISPGHIFPVETHSSGVLARRGLAEAAVDLTRLAHCKRRAAAFCHVLSAEGEEANEVELEAFASAHGIPLLWLEDLLCYRLSEERVVRQMERGDLPTIFGEFVVSVWENVLDGTHHILLQHGETSPDGEAPLVRVHSQCLTGDVFKSQRCDCGLQLQAALERILEFGHGALLYLRQEGRGIGLLAKLQAYALQERGRDTVQANQELGFEADLREYGVGAQILHEAGYERVRLMTNNPRKIRGLQSFGMTVERVSHEIEPAPNNEKYLRAKKAKLGHLLESI